MEKVILFGEDAKVLFTTFIPFENDTTAPSPQVLVVYLERSGNTISTVIKKSVQKFIKWKNEFFTLEGFDNYNDVYGD